MICRMSFFDRDEYTAAGVADLAAGDQFGLDGCTVIGRIDDASFQSDRPVDGRGAKKLNVKFSGDCTWSLVITAFFHQVIGRRPVRMAIEQGPDYTAVQNARKGLMMRLSVPLGGELVTFGKAADL